ncbi:acyltransferase family protein [Variovorax sp. RKNM96]|uniref:acyltransferase family protein n=1 Tax=Variovorax sp. RKNM96 TaxID=2681552 RepID=UPI001980E78F|nr:acyltransferase [Variovorax sp. RKNM96]QSI32676.1 acyltransferase family protein [Variovorax sp. RKNM96]
MARSMLPSNIALPRLAHVDLLRGLLVVFVILLHANLRIPFGPPELAQALGPRLAGILFRSGYYAVIVFFVVSGYLITSASIRRWGDLSQVRPAAFYRLRAARILPSLLLLLVVLGVLHLAGSAWFALDTGKVPLWRAMVAVLGLHLNWLEAQVGYLPGPWGVLWSLSVEEAFYLFFPLLCVASGSERRLCALLLVPIVLGPLARSVFSDNELWQDHSYLSGMDGIAFGCLAALLAHRVPRTPSAAVQRLVLWMGLGLGVLVFCFRKEVFQWGLTRHGLQVSLLELGIALVLVATHWRPWPWAACPVTAPLRWFGRHSYEVYLTHMFVVIPGAWLYQQADVPPAWIPLWFVAVIAASGLLGDAVARWFSEPCNRALRR